MSVTYITRNLPENEIRFSKIIWEQYNQKININTGKALEISIWLSNHNIVTNIWVTLLTTSQYNWTPLFHSAICVLLVKSLLKEPLSPYHKQTTTLTYQSLLKD